MSFFPNNERTQRKIHSSSNPQIDLPDFQGSPPSSDMVVDHIDQNKLNNHYKNLRWATSSGNAINSVRTSRSKNPEANMNQKWEQIRMYLKYDLRPIFI
jgi:adenine specific DNA methylase Mod